jgi:UDP:flavonoid glycosyltransferase YjiC (YdhE family)
LGVGTALPWRRRRHLAQAIDKVLGDQRHAAAAHKLAAALASEPDGATLTANAVDELLAEIDQQRP